MKRSRVLIIIFQGSSDCESFRDNAFPTFLQLPDFPFQVRIYSRAFAGET